MKFRDRLKDMFIVNTPDGGTRVSQSMVTNTVVLTSSILIAIGGVGQAITNLENEAITAGVVALGGIILRLTSKGGTIKARQDGSSGPTEDTSEWFEG